MLVSLHPSQTVRRFAGRAQQQPAIPYITITPPHGADDVVRNITLEWQPGAYAETHAADRGKRPVDRKSVV